ncbi:MAG: molecular chaperone HtpG [Xanthomonadales bacterium]|nr:molecular chaperone HtpG [Xanthomonadales bacterium]
MSTKTSDKNTAKVENFEFQAEAKQVLQLMIHSLYSNKEIFMRELISNGSDALDKLRFAALSDDSLYAGDGDLHIEVEVDKDAGTITIRDNGIGMDRDEVISNIGTIARSGTRKFLEALSGDDKKDANLIGQFGVGFYSSFIVADKVTLTTRKAGSDKSAGTRWESAGDGDYSLESLELDKHGTELTLHLKDGEEEFLNDWQLRNIITRYSDHIGFPIRMPEEVKVDPEDKDSETKTEWSDINKASALWTLPKSEISAEEYKKFYSHISNDFGEPLTWMHNRVEGNQSYTSLLYIPTQAPMNMMMNREDREGLKLYIKRVFIMDAAEQLLPHYLRFVRGVIDSDDLPLNVSREILQDSPLARKIQAGLVKRVLDTLEKMAKNEPEQYQKFWDNFGQVLKEGMVEDMPNQQRIAKLLRFASTRSDADTQNVSLDDYISDKADDQDDIWFISADNPAAARHSPHLEVFSKDKVEVLLMSDRIDEWMMGYFRQYGEINLKSVAKGDLSKKDDDDKTEDSAVDELLYTRIAEVLGDKVSTVKASNRLTESASCLILDENEMALHMQRLMEQAGQAMPHSAPALEINPEHAIFKKMEKEQDVERFADYSQLLYEQAILAEGGQLEDPAGFVHRINKLLV